MLVAAKSYVGERGRYDSNVNLEQVAELLDSYDPRRLAYRRGIIGRALEKKNTTGVQNADSAMLDLRAAYLNNANAWCDATGRRYQFPLLKEAYYDGDAWVEPITHPDFPKGTCIRHRLWTSVKDAVGRVDLIIYNHTSSKRRQHWLRAAAITFTEISLNVVSLSKTSSKRLALASSISLDKVFEKSKHRSNWSDNANVRG